MMGITNKVGMRFGKLLVIEKLPKKNKCNSFLYKCVCDCGNTVTIHTGNLRGNKGAWGCGCGRKPSKLRNEYGVSSMKGLYRGYINQAKHRGLDFVLTLEEFNTITKQACFYCGTPPKQVYKSVKTCYGEYIYNGIDRVDNSKGYVLDNCVPCCGECNLAKHSKTKDEFFLWISRVYHYSILGEYEYEDNRNLSHI